MSNAQAVAVRVPKCLVRTCFVLNPRPQITPPPNSPTPHTSNNNTSQPPVPKEHIKEPVATQERVYTFARWVAWIAFAAQVISIGMSVFVTQLLTVAFIGIPTFALVQKVGCNDTRIGRRLT